MRAFHVMTKTMRFARLGRRAGRRRRSSLDGALASMAVVSEARLTLICRASATPALELARNYIPDVLLEQLHEAGAEELARRV
mmetsp:Transcript_7837/g.25843  ORF Transcript_7837/g.25843 Transcript_7837/m.25843 type:complete len:83 (-) Transcript_7837:2806-3054(-)